MIQPNKNKWPAGSIGETIVNLQDELANCADSLKGCFLAKDLGQLYLNVGEMTKARHYWMVAGEGFVREGSVYQAMAVFCKLRNLPESEEQVHHLKNLIAETFSVQKHRRRDSDVGLPLPTPFVEFTASISLDDASEDEIQRAQIGSPGTFSYELISSLRMPELAQLLEVVKGRKIMPGENLYSEGDASTHFYIVTSGELNLVSKNDYRQVFHVGEFVGDVSYFAGIRRGATVTAAVESEVLEFSGKDFVESFKKFPNLQERVWYFFEKKLFLNIATRTGLFNGLTREELTSCYEYFTPVNAPAGRVLFREKSTVQRIIFLAQGQAQYQVNDVTKNTFKVGQFIAENEFICAKELDGKIVAETDVYVLELRRELFEKLCQTYPRLQENQRQLADQEVLTLSPEQTLID